MNRAASMEALFLPDEKFDFDVSLSPCSTADEAEDEVFVGPVSHKEHCVSVAVVSGLQGGGSRDTRVSWSPLTDEQLELMCQEAHKLADRLQNDKPHDASTSGDINTEDFIQDSEAKLGMLDPVGRVLSPVKRETFCVQDSPMKQLPPAIQRQMLRGSTARASRTSSTSASAAPSARLSASAAPSARLSTSSARLSLSSACKPSPRDAIKPLGRPVLRGKASLGGTAMLPNRPAAPSSSCPASKGRMERSRLQPPSKVASGLKRSPSSRRSVQPQPCEDLRSGTARVAADLSDSSVISSMSGKRTLAPPTKTVGVKKQSEGKAPSLQNRRNTSSSSSSVSSFNSSVSLSPAKGVVSSLSCSFGPTPESVSRARRPTAEPPRPTASRRSLSAHSRLPEAECVKPARPSLLKRAESTPTQATPSKRLMERRASSRLQGALKALALPTPAAGSKAAAHSDGVSSVPRPTGLRSLSSMDSLPQKLSIGPLTPSTLQMKGRRPSALPTPVRRPVSAIPSPLSTNLARTIRPAAVSDSDIVSASKGCSFSPTAKPVKEEEPVGVPDIQPFCLEEEEESSAPPPSPPRQPEHTESPGVNEPGPEESEPSSNKIKTPEENKTKQVLLLDLPAPTPQPQEKLLIDLTNTPDLMRTATKTGSAAQLIDLSSPLIKWSPDEKSENTALLVNLSF